MIDQSTGTAVRRPVGDPPAAPHRTRARTRAPSGPARLLVLLAAFVCAACGLVYELELVALGGRLIGDPVTQTSLVLSVMVFAMGLGSLLAKRLTRRPAAAFAVVESLLALTGGLSGLALYACWAWLGGCRAATVGLAALIGVLVGTEIPLLMTLVQRIRREDAGHAVADLFAADYVGALVGGLAFPFLLLPALGQAAGAILAGAVNAVAGGAVALWLFRDESPPRTRLLLRAACGLVLAALAAAACGTPAVERAARRTLYGDRVRLAEQGLHQEVVLTGTASGAGLRLYLDGRPVLCAADRDRLPQALTRPAMAGPHRRVLVLGGGGGLVVREVLRHPGVRRVVAVQPDPDVTRLARTDPALTALNGHALDDPRVLVAAADPLVWLRGAAAAAPPFDVVLVDPPGPGDAHGADLRTEEFYGLAARLLAPRGRLAVAAGPFGSGAGTADRGRFRTVEAALRAVPLRTAAYTVRQAASGCGSTADQGFLLAAPPGGGALARPVPPAVPAASGTGPLPPPETLLRPLR
ncbi:fused MFS/spermidine synthase [Streptacidiphilus sp. ASG 303]|uniref:fused MFS/spermidine synthase n=1 Tax=Streptacidiphilus sp. ASG 303 TaxID=2896847 RepID=UPI0035B04932